MIRQIRVDAKDSRFVHLVDELNAFLKITDGDEHEFYDQYNQLDDIKNVILVLDSELPIACGAIKRFDKQSYEVKRMYTSESYRGKGIASSVLSSLEKWAEELGAEYCILETGKRQHAAVQLYHRCGYDVIPNYGQYQGMENSICFRKKL